MKLQSVRTMAIELRQTHRYPLSAAAFVCWPAPNGSLDSCDGMTRDINTAGAFIWSLKVPPLGARVQLDIMLPNSMGGEIGPHLAGEGVVLRVEPDHTRASGTRESGFAVSVQFYVQSSESVLSTLMRSKRVM